MDLAAAFLVVSIGANAALAYALWREHRTADSWEGLALYWQHQYEQWMAECGPRLD